MARLRNMRTTQELRAIEAAEEAGVRIRKRTIRHSYDDVSINKTERSWKSQRQTRWK